MFEVPKVAVYKWGKNKNVLFAEGLMSIGSERMLVNVKPRSFSIVRESENSSFSAIFTTAV